MKDRGGSDKEVANLVQSINQRNCVEDRSLQRVYIEVFIVTRKIKYGRVHCYILSSQLQIMVIVDVRKINNLLTG